MQALRQWRHYLLACKGHTPARAKWRISEMRQRLLHTCSSLLQPSRSPLLQPSRSPLFHPHPALPPIFMWSAQTHHSPLFSSTTSLSSSFPSAPMLHAACTLILHAQQHLLHSSRSAARLPLSIPASSTTQHPWAAPASTGSPSISNFDLRR